MLPDYLFSSSDGNLYDTRKPGWDKMPPLRHRYNFAAKTIKAGRDLRALLRHGGYGWPGGYPLILRNLQTGETISVAAVAKSLSAYAEMLREIRYYGTVFHLDTYYEGPPLVCDYTGAEIESAYGGAE